LSLLYPATGCIEDVLAKADVWCVLCIKWLEARCRHTRKYVISALALISLGSALRNRLPPSLFIGGFRSVVTAEQSQRQSNHCGSAH
jgi:hypothetical protein